ncbi:MAG: DUF488 domain-containing protein [Actinobacteria bacterium]|nr:DUF488 domain-containing protein [Actinomycetota bacterium]
MFTVGHGTRSEDDLAAVLLDAGIDRLVDVRRYPGSRRHPHFARAAMETWLPDRGVIYDWRGETLGGRREHDNPQTRHPSLRNKSFQGYADYMDTNEFRDAVLQLERDAEQEKVAIMCAETLWWRCHRRMISDALVARGNEVIHLMKPGDRNAHKPVAEMRVGEDGWPVYDLGPLKLLD